jgi:hypothetical protein
MCAAAHSLVLKALGGARPRYSSLLAQRRVTRRKGPRRLAPCCRKGFPALLALPGARKLSRAIHGPRPAGAASGDNRPPGRFIAPCGRSDMHALLPETAVMLGGVNGIEVHHPPSVGRAAPAAKCRAQPDLRSARSPLVQPSTAGKSERSGDQAVGCRFFWLLFFAARQRKVVLVR